MKLEAFPFTRHGFLEGIVEHVSADAIADEQRGLVFPARIRITNSRLRNVENRLRGEVEPANVASSGEQRMRASGGQDGSRDEAARASSIANLLTPGMSAQVEVITGRRSVLSYLLSPISRATNEAGRER